MRARLAPSCALSQQRSASAITDAVAGMTPTTPRPHQTRTSTLFRACVHLVLARSSLESAKLQVAKAGAQLQENMSAISTSGAKWVRYMYSVHVSC
jgi:hypothetical protein